MESPEDHFERGDREHGDEQFTTKKSKPTWWPVKVHIKIVLAPGEMTVSGPTSGGDP